MAFIYLFYQLMVTVHLLGKFPVYMSNFCFFLLYLDSMSH